MADTSEHGYAERRAEEMEDEAYYLHRKASAYRRAATALREQGGPDEGPELEMLASYAQHGDEWAFPSRWDEENWKALTRLVRAGLLVCGFRAHLWGNSTSMRDATFRWSEPLALVVERNAHTAQEWEELKQRYGNKCLACGVSELEVSLQKDHIVPRSKHGCSHIDNMQPLCGPCNNRKGTRTINYRPDLNGHHVEGSTS